MYGLFTYIWLIFMVNVGKYTIHGSYGLWHEPWNLLILKKNVQGGPKVTSYTVTPLKINMFSPEHDVPWFSRGCILRFHVNLPGCIFITSHNFIEIGVINKSSISNDRLRRPTGCTSPTETRHCWGEIPQNYHRFASFDPFKGKSWVPMGEYPRYIPTYTTYIGVI